MMNATDAPVFDSELIARYDSSGPRYTSYPTAPHFVDSFDETALRTAIRISNEEPIPSSLSLYVHVPFCFSPCFYCGCNRIITRDIGRADAYLERLYREIELTGELFDRDRVVRQLHFGGGTPNFLDLPRMREVLHVLGSHFHLSGDAHREFGIEIDPRYVDTDYIRGLGEAGMNRMSIGIQDFDPEVQRAVNRVQSVEQVAAIMRAGRECGFGSISVDLIYGLPHQTVERFTRTLDQVIALGPDRIATYSYAHLPELFKAQRRLEREALPDAQTKLALFGRTLERLTAAGYVYIGMDHFARANDDLARAQRAGTLQRNFQGYSTHGDCDIAGLGVSAIGRVGSTYSQNARDLPTYYAALDAGHLPVVRGLQLNTDDLVRRELIGELMCHGEVDKVAFGDAHGLRFDDYFAEDLKRLAPLVADGLVCDGTDAVRVTARGRLLIRHVAMCFDAYLRSNTTSTKYSRAI
ncbi:oxygen-independent coproporphyrinogen III oxidase [Oleiagrimonas sp. MCCC 1A03011]|uniref:oxygen-independent coproporphyrinogen III oxidase n=1 Tax=Oleiagrimonas sp. MCCC 1A03011 TaxID=1926883 RepID=UPI000DC2509E|nr:oxygen-independent coproporphyrinogen III oxidase [Oleiagrimonas sp. MCCC 1A03011]RAP58387.1 oxygen-independent coproporphyrinogen III oxidase [Oleiagrimonas sp. MCCC 1A03011]